MIMPKKVNDEPSILSETSVDGTMSPQFNKTRMSDLDQKTTRLCYTKNSSSLPFG